MEYVVFGRSNQGAFTSNTLHLLTLGLYPVLDKCISCVQVSDAPCALILVVVKFGVDDQKWS